MERRPLDWAQVDEALNGLRQLRNVEVTYVKRAEQDGAFIKLVREKLPMTCERKSLSYCWHQRLGGGCCTHKATKPTADNGNF